MSKTGPIILVEDDLHDQDVVKSALADNGVKNQILTFEDAAEVIQYLATTSDKPFLILCDIRMKGMNGLELRDTINDDETLRKRAIPFVFFTAAASQEIVNVAYGLTVQGFLEKPNSYEELKDMLKKVVHYWSICLHPNSF
jgi:CheY-like chemotaxis protein